MMDIIELDIQLPGGRLRKLRVDMQLFCNNSVIRLRLDPDLYNARLVRKRVHGAIVFYLEGVTPDGKQFRNIAVSMTNSRFKSMCSSIRRMQSSCPVSLLESLTEKIRGIVGPDVFVHNDYCTINIGEPYYMRVEPTIEGRVAVLVGDTIRDMGVEEFLSYLRSLRDFYGSLPTSVIRTRGGGSGGGDVFEGAEWGEA